MENNVDVCESDRAVREKGSPSKKTGEAGIQKEKQEGSEERADK